jgi:hypothetical protein
MSRRAMGNERDTSLNDGGDTSAPGQLHGRAELQNAGRHLRHRQSLTTTQHVASALPTGYETEALKESGAKGQSSCAFKEPFMTRNGKQSGWNIEEVTDAEVSAAIHYLDSDSSSENGAGSDSATRGICLILMSLFLEFATFVLLYCHTRSGQASLC